MLFEVLVLSNAVWVIEAILSWLLFGRRALATAFVSLDCIDNEKYDEEKSQDSADDHGDERLL